MARCWCRQRLTEAVVQALLVSLAVLVRDELLDGEAAMLGVGEPETARAEVLSEDAVLFRR